MHTPTHMSSTCCAVSLPLSRFNILSHCLHTTQGDTKNTRDVSLCKIHDDGRMHNPHRAHPRTLSVGVATMSPRSVNLSARVLYWANIAHRVFKTWTCYTSHDTLRHSLNRRGKKNGVWLRPMHARRHCISTYVFDPLLECTHVLVNVILFHPHAHTHWAGWTWKPAWKMNKQASRCGKDQIDGDTDKQIDRGTEYLFCGLENISLKSHNFGSSLPASDLQNLCCAAYQ